jgi:hypothetical protein
MENRDMKIIYDGRQKTEIQLANLQAILRKITKQNKSSIKKAISRRKLRMKQNLVFQFKYTPSSRQNKNKKRPAP